MTINSKLEFCSQKIPLQDTTAIQSEHPLLAFECCLAFLALGCFVWINKVVTTYKSLLTNRTNMTNALICNHNQRMVQLICCPYIYMAALMSPWPVAMMMCWPGGLADQPIWPIHSYHRCWLHYLRFASALPSTLVTMWKVRFNSKHHVHHHFLCLVWR